MSAYKGTNSPLDDQTLAAMAAAGWRFINQTTVSATGSADVTYTVTGADTRRVVVYYGGTGATDIRFNFGAAATATTFPIAAQTNVVFYAVAGEVLHFYNTTSTASVYVMEIA